MNSTPDSAHKDNAPKSRLRRISVAQFGMAIFLVSLGVLFAGSLAAYLITRYNHPAWQLAQVGLPWGLLVSTVFLIGVSVCLELAVRSIARNRPEALRKWVRFTALLATGFLLGQALNWHEIQRLNPGENARIISLFTFYLLTGLHAAHVLGGFVPLFVVYQRSRQREYSSSRFEGVRFCAQYWHFLLGVWFVLLATLYFV